MMSLFSNRKASHKEPLQPKLSKAPFNLPESTGLFLASTYRVKRPSTDAVNAFKLQVGWDKLDEEGRYRVQQYLFVLVARAGGASIKYPYREAIVADFAVGIDTTARYQQQERVLADVPRLNRDLETARLGRHLAEGQVRELRSQYDELLSERDVLLEECASETARANELHVRLEKHRQNTSQLYADLPPARGGVRLQGQARDARQRFSLMVVPSAPSEFAEPISRNVDDRSSVASA